ncbi:MAG: helix-turn-helix domain-containing protein [Micavibrio sp.]|nr:helix-turn-helix domain-containing protein [Micavibrio sp.]
MSNRKIIKNIAGNLKRLREENGLSQAAVAKYLHVSFQQIQKYEDGSNRITADKIYRLKNLYKTAYEEFFSNLQE